MYKYNTGTNIYYILLMVLRKSKCSALIMTRSRTEVCSTSTPNDTPTQQCSNALLVSGCVAGHCADGTYPMNSFIPVMMVLHYSLILWHCSCP